MQTKNDKLFLNRNGKDIECDILFTFDSDDTKKGYVCYTDYSLNSDNKVNIYVSSFNPFLSNKRLDDVTDPKEIEMVDDIIENIRQKRY